MKVFIPPHYRVVEGRAVKVTGYWREVRSLDELDLEEKDALEKQRKKIRAVGRSAETLRKVDAEQRAEAATTRQMWAQADELVGAFPSGRRERPKKWQFTNAQAQALVVALTRVWVPPHLSHTKTGKPTHVDGYWRRARVGENLEGKLTDRDVGVEKWSKELWGGKAAAEALWDVLEHAELSPAQSQAVGDRAAWIFFERKKPTRAKLDKWRKLDPETRRKLYVQAAREVKKSKGPGSPAWFQKKEAQKPTAVSRLVEKAQAGGLSDRKPVRRIVPTGTLTPREAAMARQYPSTHLEYVGDGHNKFWSAQIQQGNVVHVAWGKIGTKGQSKDYSFQHMADAQAFFDKKHHEKVAEGYSDASSSPAPAPTPVEPKPIPQPKPVAKPKPSSALETSLVYQQGGSNKFWKASVHGKTVTSHWGKIGTEGQTKDFSFPTELEAQAYFNKKVTEKLVKGYVPDAVVSQPAPVPAPKVTAVPPPPKPEKVVAKPQAAAVDTTVDVGMPDHAKPQAAQAGAWTAVGKSKEELAAIAQKNGVAVDPSWTKVQIMDAIREALGTFDPEMQIDPAKAQDLHDKIHWDKPGHEYDALKPYLNDQWVLEPKFDGARFRIFLGASGNTANGGRRSTQTFKYIERADNFPQFRDTVVPELAGTILDGELLPPTDSIEIHPGEFTQGSLNTIMSLVNINPKDAVARQKKNGKAVFMAFDVLAVNGEDVTNLPLEQRRKMLEMIMELLQSREPAFQIAPQFEATEDNIRASIDKGMEGVMLKRKDSTYKPGARMASWQKVKKMSSGDFFIIGSVPGKNSNAGKVGSLKVAYMGEDGKPVYVADVAGFDEATRTQLTDPATGDVKPEYLGKVIEVMGQGRTKHNRIRHPRFIRWRDDKTSEETDKSQFELFAPV